MSGQNFPNSQVGPGFSFNFYRPQLRPSSGSTTSMPQTNARMVAPNRNTLISCHAVPLVADGPVNRSNLHSIHEKPSTSSASPNLTVLNSTGMCPTSAVASLQSHAVLNSFFQSLLRGQVPISNTTIALPQANVSGYINTMPSCNGRFVPSKSTPNLPPEPNNTHGPHIVSAHSIPSSNALPLLTSGSAGQPRPRHDNPPSSASSSSSASSIRLPLTTVNPLDALFHPSNLTTVTTSTKHPPERKYQQLSGIAFLRWASVFTRNFRRTRISPWPHAQSDVDALHGMNWIVAPTGLLGIYSESPFLRPVLLLRRVQFATPGSLVTSIPDPDNMVRTLREIADNKVSKHPGFAPLFPRLASTVGFCTDFLSYVFTLDLDRLLVKVLSDQAKAGTRHTGPEWHVVLRLAWATSNFYVPPPTNEKQMRHFRALVQESLPRCLNVRVAGRPITLPDPIFHGGQAQRLGKRLKLSIDITDKLPMKSNTPIRNRFVDIEITWLHAPLEDQSVDHLDLVAGGQITPLLCHLIGLPLVQVTFDRMYTIPDLRSAFQPNTTSVIDGPLVEGPHKNDILPLMYNTDGMISDLQHGVYGAYDNCMPPSRRITIQSAVSSLKSKLEKTLDDDLCITDGESEDLNYIPLCLLCPLTRTRIQLPVRSVNCEHLQCFDLTSYLIINRRRPRWTCPICSAPAPFRDLRLDELFVSILEDPRGASATFIHLDPDGQWRVVPEESEDNNNAASDEARDIKVPVKPPTLTGPNLSPVSPTHAPGTTREPAATSRDAEQSVGEKEYEIIILSDDDDDDDDDDRGLAGVAASATPVTSTAHVPTSHAPIFTSPSKRDSSEPPVDVTSITRESSCSVPSRLLSAHSVQDAIEIDLTNDDDDSDDARSVTPVLNLVAGPSSEASPVISCATATITTADGTAGTGKTTSKPLDADVLQTQEPLIVISPLPLTLNSTHNGATPESTSRPASQTNATASDGSETTRDPVGNCASPSYRHLFDTISSLRAEHLSKLNSQIHPHTNSKRPVIPSPTNNSSVEDGPSRAKRKHASRENPGTASATATQSHASSSEQTTIRPASSYMENPSDADVPGLDLDEFSDTENDFVATTTPVFPSNPRPRGPNLKSKQSVALARLMQQRSFRQPSRNSDELQQGNTNSSRSTSRHSQQPHQPPPPPPPQHGQINRKRIRKPSVRRRRVSAGDNWTDESDASDGVDAVSSEMSCVSASDPSACSDSACEDVDDEEDLSSVSSDSSDDRWSPSRSRSRSMNTRSRAKRKQPTRR